jgi:hypothetical protein
MGIIKKFKDFLNPISLEKYLLENNDKYLKELENLKGDIFITQNSNKAFIPDEDYRQEYDWLNNQIEKIYGKDNNYKWVYFNDYKSEIYYVNDYKTSVLEIKEVDKYKNVSIFLTKQVDLKDKEIKEATKKESGYIWETIDNLMFVTFNNDPKWGINTSHYLSSGLIVLEIFGFDIKSDIDNNSENNKEFQRHAKWMKEQLEIISGHPFKMNIDYKKFSRDTSVYSIGCNIHFKINYPYL